MEERKLWRLSCSVLQAADGQALSAYVSLALMGTAAKRERSWVPLVFFSCELNTTASSPCAAETEGWRSCVLSWQSWSPEPLPSELAGGWECNSSCVLNFWRWAGSMWRTPDLSYWQLEGIWWLGSLVAFQSHLLCVCRPQTTGSETRSCGHPKSQMFMKPLKKSLWKNRALGHGDEELLYQQDCTN